MWGRLTTISSAGEPKTLIVPESLYLSIASLTAMAAAAAAVHIVLWPQPWPGAPSTSGSWVGNAAFLGEHGQGVELARGARSRACPEP